MKTFITVAVGALLTVISVPLTGYLIQRWGLMRPNFRGDVIPAGFGFMLVVVASSAYIIMLLLGWGDRLTIIFLSAVAGFGILGLLDDIYGSRETGGFRGHFKLLLRGKVSTGLIKAIGGGLLALLLGGILAGFAPGRSIINALTIALSANLLNLLDLRPGRAVSCFWVGMLVIVLVKIGRLAAWNELAVMIVATVVLTVLDRSARVMMGDAGSNTLGAVLGIIMVLELGLPSLIVVVLLMAVVHAYSEKYSISKLIESSRALRSLDRLLGER